MGKLISNVDDNQTRKIRLFSKIPVYDKGRTNLLKEMRLDMKKSIHVMLMIFLVSAPMWAKVINDKVGTAGFQFLKIGVGARNTALGGANIANPDGATAMFWNPAGICLDHKINTVLFHNNWIATINHNFIGFTLPFTDNDFIAASVNYITMDDMEETTLEQPQGTGIFFSASDYAATATYGRRITDRFMAAISVKYINETIWDMVSDGWAFDVGFIYNYQRLHLGMSFTNFGVNKQISGDQLEFEYQIYPDYKNDEVLLNYVTKTIRLPMSFRFGAGFDLLKNDNHMISAMTSIDYYNDIGETNNIGLEYGFKNNYFLRGGYQFNRTGFGMSFGAGIRCNLKNNELMFNYAAIDLQNFNLRHQTEISFSF